MFKDEEGRARRSAADELPRSIVVERLPQLFVRAHHERATACDGLAEGTPGDEEHSTGRGIACRGEAIASVEHGELSALDLAPCRPEADGAVGDVHERVVSGGKGRREADAALEGHVE